MPFQSTLPMRGATSPKWIQMMTFDFNPRSPCGERINPGGFGHHPGISIHAPHAGSDSVDDLQHPVILRVFQSTLPMRGASCTVNLAFFISGISIHAPHAGSDQAGHCKVGDQLISIHAPHAGSDRNHAYDYIGPRFQSTLPMRGAIV